MTKRNLKESLLDLLERKHLLSVGDILEHLKNSGRKFNKTSVYRSLENLIDENKVCRHYFNEAQALYELRGHDHTHLVCTNCGKVEEGRCDYEQPKKVDNFTVDHHHLTLVGLCQNCLIA